MNKTVFAIKPIIPETILLLFRIAVSLMMITHGWSKISNYSERLGEFPDPLGIGVAISLQLTIFAEVVCSVLLILGLLTRISLIPLMIAMITAAFVVHGDDSFSDQELPLFYLLTYVFLFFRGPGVYSIDAQLAKKKRY